MSSSADDRTRVALSGKDDSTSTEGTLVDPADASRGADQTMVEATVVVEEVDSVAGTQIDAPEADSEGTLVDEAPAIGRAPDAGQTLADPQLASSEPEAFDDDGTLVVGTIVSPSLAPAGSRVHQEIDEQATLAGPHAVPHADDEQTLITEDPDATAFNASAFGDDSRAGTQLDSAARSQSRSNLSNSGTMLESEFAKGAAPGDAPDAGPTLMTGVSQPNATPGTAKKPKPKGAHETADRWESEQRYSLISNFARGGLGQIWLAQDTRLRREVAYKEMLPKALKNRQALERFLEEAQITGQLEHPCIMPIYDIGYQRNGAPFYSMKFVRGETLEKIIDQYHELPAEHPDRPLQFRRLLKNFLDICNALAFAHDRGVIHRDLKPLNVMIGSFGETLVLDWGLAKAIGSAVPDADLSPITTSTGELGTESATVQDRSGTSQMSAQGTQLDAASVLGQSQVGPSVSATKRHVFTDVRSQGSETLMGSIMGTPAYMPPEQAAGLLDQLDGRCDIYSLGGILYKLLTKHQPIEKGQLKEVLARVREGKIIPPRQHDPKVPAPLEAICLKAMATRKEDRYSTALLLAKDVEAWLGDEPVSCFEDPFPVKARRWIKKHRTTVTSASVVTAAMLLLWIGSAWLRRLEVNRLHGIAEVALSSADRDADNANFGPARATLEEAIKQVAYLDALNDVEDVLKARLENIDLQRVEQLRRAIEARLEIASEEISDGRFELARTTLTEQRTRLIHEPQLDELRAQIDRELKRVEMSIAERAQVADTQQRFEQFRSEVDTVRARGSLRDPDAIDEDAKLALAAGHRALELFDLDHAAPLAKPPKYFEPDLPWTRAFHVKTARWPVDVLREETFEVLVTLAEMESTLTRQDQPEVIQAAARRALSWLEKAVTLGIQSQALHARRAILLSVLGETGAASKAEAAARAITPQRAFDFYLLGEFLRKQGDYPNALSLYLKAQRVDPNHYWVQYFTGLCYMQLGQPAGAVSCFSSCVALRSNYSWSFMLRGLAYSQMKDFESAHQDYTVALKLAPNLFNIYVNRGATYFLEKRYPEALADFAKAGEIEPGSTLPHMNTAQVHWAMAERSRVEGDPALSELDRLAAEQRLFGQSLQALNRAAQMERAPASPGLYQMRARVHERLANLEVALQDLRTHIRLERHPAAKAASFKLMGQIQSQRGDHAAAIEAYRSARQLEPADPETIYRLGETHLQLRQFEEALKAYQEFQRMMNLSIEEKVPNADQLYSGMATAYDALRRKPDAIEFYTLSLLLDRNQAVPLTKRAWSYLLHGTTLAKKDFEEALKANPKNPDTLIGLAYACSQLDQFEEAQKYVAQSIDLIREQARQPKVGAQAWVLFHNAATVYAQIYDRLRANEKVSVEQKEQLVTNAVVLLDDALKTASTNPAQLQGAVINLTRDTALDPIRKHPVFEAFAKRVMGPGK